MELMPGIYLVGSGEFGISDTYDCHTYLVDGGTGAVLIEAGAGRSPQRILDNAAAHIPVDRIEKVLLTHTHADHSGGTPFFRSRGIKAFASEDEMAFMRDKPADVIDAFIRARNDASYPADYEYPFIEVDGMLKDGQKIQVGSLEIRCMQLKGHSVGLLCYLLEVGGKRILFSSDYIFHGGRIGLLNCPGSDLGAYRNDIGKLSGLRIDALFPGHKMFTLHDGQRHIDKAIKSLENAFVPNTF